MANEKESTSKLDGLMKQLEEGVSGIFQSGEYEQWLNTMSKFHHYSWRNNVLIFMQRPDATLVAGYHSWQNNFHRHVKRGASGIKIIAPVSFKSTILVKKVDPKTGETMLDADGNPVMVEKRIEQMRYKVENVFDVSDTDGEPLPELGVEELSGDADEYMYMLEVLTRGAPVPVSFEEIEGPAKGFYSRAENRIVVRSGMSEVQTLKTLVHELAHARLHSDDTPASKSDGQEIKSRNKKEVEAESVAYVVCKHLGIDTSDYSFGYIAGWSNGKEMPELHDSLELIQQTVSGFIDEIDAELKVVRQNLREEEKTVSKESEIAEDTRKFDSVEFEKLLPPEMRFKEVTAVNNNKDVFWVTQDIFNEDDLRVFQEAINEYKPDYNVFYVTARDLSGYDFTEDMERKVLAIVTSDTIRADDYFEAVYKEGLEECLDRDEPLDDTTFAEIDGELKKFPNEDAALDALEAAKEAPAVTELTEEEHSEWTSLVERLEKVKAGLNAGNSDANRAEGVMQQSASEQPHQASETRTVIPTEVKVVDRYNSYIARTDGQPEPIAITKSEDNKYYVHFNYDEAQGAGAAGTGPFKTLADARVDVKAHRPDAVRIKESIKKKIEEAKERLAVNDVKSHDREQPKTR